MPKNQSRQAELAKLIDQMWIGCDALYCSHMGSESQTIVWKQARDARDKAIALINKPDR
jgi:hypothetical protein